MLLDLFCCVPQCCLLVPATSTHVSALFVGNFFVRVGSCSLILVVLSLQSIATVATTIPCDLPWSHGPSLAAQDRLKTSQLHGIAHVGMAE